MKKKNRSPKTVRIKTNIKTRNKFYFEKPKSTHQTHQVLEKRKGRGRLEKRLEESNHQ
ncbi:hypothetical protein HYD86_02780 [Mycoplasmopsis bovis]|nr:hypothetical protein [Mycoplasmopsis bovis]QQH36911.1 hypothetical protein HYD86_02780 [Mycoplasmopsis bovis]